MSETTQLGGRFFEGAAAIERGRLLFQQGRHELAIQEFQRALAANPQDPFAHAFIALCLSELKQYAEASDAAARAITFAPDLPFAHYVAAHVFHDRNRFPESERAINEAIRLDPYNAAYQGLAALLRINASDWRGALQRANKGLEIDPDDPMCSNARAMALVKLGRAGHAQSELESSRSRDPDNAFTHANLGWAALERGERDRALESFREALRINPNLDWARDGMVHAIKLRYPFYSLFLRYLLWMQRLSGRAQFGVIIGAYLGYRLVYAQAQNSPEWRPWLMPFIVAYIAFAYLSWVARPITNLVLRLNRFGRAILDPDERRESNLVAASLAVAVGAGALYLYDRGPAALIAMIVGLAIVIPLSKILRCDEGWPRKLLTAYSIGMSLLGTATVACIVLANRLQNEKLGDFAILLINLFVVAVIVAQLGANGLGMVRPRR